MQLTLAKLLDAIEKNGLPKIRDGQYLAYPEIDEDGWVITDWGAPPIGGCALGQAAVNLGTGPYRISELYYSWISKRFLLDYTGGDRPSREIDITALNDDTDMTLPEIAATVREALKDHLDVVLGEI